MTTVKTKPKDQIKRYLATGESDMLCLAWGGSDHVEGFEGFGVSAKTAGDRDIVTIVRAACERRNGWKVIAEACR